MKSLKEIKHKVGAKLFLSGEYAITKANYRSIVMHIPKYTYATIQPSSQLHIHSTLFNFTIHSLDDNIHYQLIIDTIKFIKRYLNEQTIHFQPFKLTIESELYHQNQKYGLGSSGAIVVLLIRSILKFHNVNLSNIELFKLCTIFLTLNNDNGSFADIACIIFETTIVYRNFNRTFINNQQSLNTLMQNDFNTLQITPYQFPFSFTLSIVWSKIQASSKRLVNEIQLNDKFNTRSEQLIERYLHCKTWTEFKSIMNQNRINLQQLSPKIEIDPLFEICNLAEYNQLCAKSSGAGGGDCAIVFYQNQRHYSAFKNEITYPIILEVTYE